MSAMQSFWQWWFEELPAFLMSEPIKYIFGLCIFTFILKIVLSFFTWNDRTRK